MAVGTAGGLLDSPKSTSVFKHEILRQYSKAFLAKVASKSDGHRVMVLDGFAGRGRFDDGTPGSAELFMQAAADLAGVSTAIRLFERNAVDADRLATVASEYVQRGVDVAVERADISTRLEETVAAAAGIPLFLFLDPCGQNLPFDLVVKVLRDVRGGTWPPTEALLNLSADFTRRIGGVLNKGLDTAGLLSMDRMMGGDWWREVVLEAHDDTRDGSWGPAADAVARQYVQRLSDAAKMDHVLVPVRRRPDNQPTYHLAYLTRSPHGQWVMADALAKARQVWLRDVGPQEDDTQQSLFELDPVGEMILSEQETAMRRAKLRLQGLAARELKFSLLDHVLVAFGDDYGVLTESNLGKVMAELVKDGKVVRDPGQRLAKAIYTYKG